MPASIRDPTAREKAPGNGVRIPADLPILPPGIIDWDNGRNRRQPYAPELPLEIPEVPDEPDGPQRDVIVDYSIRFYER